jgi:hypothetical protein
VSVTVRDNTIEVGVRALSARLAPSHQYCAVSADGQRFLAVEPFAAPYRRMTAIVNWTVPTNV